MKAGTQERSLKGPEISGPFLAWTELMGEAAGRAEASCACHAPMSRRDPPTGPVCRTPVCGTSEGRQAGEQSGVQVLLF